MKYFLFALLFVDAMWAMPGFYEPWGKDADLKAPSEEQAPLFQEKKKNSPMAWTAQKIIRFHQNFLSQADGPRSHFRPSSSGYMLEAIQKHGFIMGYLMGCDRLMRENSEEWVYRTVEYDGRTLKWNPPP